MSQEKESCRTLLSLEFGVVTICAESIQPPAEQRLAFAVKVSGLRAGWLIECAP